MVIGPVHCRRAQLCLVLPVVYIVCVIWPAQSVICTLSSRDQVASISCRLGRWNFLGGVKREPGSSDSRNLSF
ncbi:hypothetical protein BO70DRAFT_318769 [Aspergillus heteromorphus CBS 117.55]|uniref:Uncharacterized protein n=1 Tax=Aspergillus heteromorphus CBS 117.55 TaxID=1448321 RepID=A0A317VM50_9EURO|nr:uncharacterized protein BO70DRAFT_318769 [Aspergillus heteromorphus CBS 117.55]PWY75426.1 hypothetical protein BO70DRAFT_318769 [Aspergillus heteromorphus CBS 117.55]